MLREAMGADALPLEEVSLYGALVHVVAQDIQVLSGEVSTLLQNSGIEIEHMAVIEPTLEDVFISCMR